MNRQRPTNTESEILAQASVQVSCPEGHTFMVLEANILNLQGQSFQGLCQKCNAQTTLTKKPTRNFQPPLFGNMFGNSPMA